MKIIYLHQYFKFPSENGGTRSYDLSKKFVKDGKHNVDIVTTTSNIKYKTSNKRWNLYKQDGINVHYLYLPYNNSFSYFKRIIVFFKFLFFSTIKIINMKGDIILATSTPLSVGIPPIIKKIYDKTPFIFEVRDVWPEVPISLGLINNKLIQKILYILEKYIYLKASLIVPLSSDMKDSIINRYPIFYNKIIYVVENISEINRFQLGYNKEYSYIKDRICFKPKISILYAGTFGLVNGLEYVIELAVKVKR